MAHRKFRVENGLFLAEGTKLVGEFLECFDCRLLAATDAWLSRNHLPKGLQANTVTSEELRKASLQQSPQEVLALFRIPEMKGDLSVAAAKELCIALDGVQDPGNLGTIVRLADWFGIENIFCSTGTADIFNPKAVQATMGALARVNVHYCNLEESIRKLPATVPTYGTFMDGCNIYTGSLSNNGVIVMGNEGKGISDAISSLVNHRIGIPSFPADRATSESLNVAVATAIICSEFRRRTL